MPYRKFYYSPFKKKLQDKSLRENSAKYKTDAEKYKVCWPTIDWAKIRANQIINRERNGCLHYEGGEVEPNMTVLVFGHGATQGANFFSSVESRDTSGAPVISPTSSAREMSAKGLYLTPEILAHCIEAEGLPKTHRLIKMCTCFGSGTESAPLSQRAYTADDHFARALAMTLSQSRGYRDILVGGYTAETRVLDLGTDDGTHMGYSRQVYSFQNPDDPDGSKAWIPVTKSNRSSYLYWYDGAGRRTSKAGDPV